MTAAQSIAASEKLLVDRLFRADAKDVLDWTEKFCSNPYQEGRARDIQAIMRSRREALLKIHVKVWC